MIGVRCMSDYISYPFLIVIECVAAQVTSIETASKAVSITPAGRRDRVDVIPQSVACSNLIRSDQI